MKSYKELNESLADELMKMKGAKPRGSVTDQKAARDAVIAKRKETNPNPPALGTSSDKYKLGGYDKKSNRSYSEEVELEEGKIPVNHAHDAVGSVLGQSAAVKFASNLKAVTTKHTTWKDINSALVKQGEQTHHIAKIAAKLKPTQYNEEVEELDEVSMSTLDSYRKKAFDEPGFKRQAGRKLAYDKSSSHGDSKVKSSEEIDVAKSQIKDLIKPEHHSKYPISKITSMSHGRKIYRDASAAGHLREEVELEEAHKIGTKVTIHKGSGAGITGRIGEISRKHKGDTDPSYTIFHGDNQAIRASKNQFKTIKEEVELDEKELTDIDVKQKEKVVKGMKKNLQSFKDKYGERAKGVMYATATNIAKKMPD
jgi:hypothetical protein